MKNKSRHSSGFSLIELMITTVISAVMCAVIGTIVIYANNSWKKVQDVTMMSSGGRNVKTAIEYRLRQAVTLPFVGPHYFLSTSEAFILPGNVGISFNVIDWSLDRVTHSNPRFRRDKFTYDAGTSRLTYQYWYATTSGSLLFYPTTPSGSVVLLNDASGFTVAPHPSNPNEWVITISQSKDSEGQTITSQTAFRVVGRILQ